MHSKCMYCTCTCIYIKLPSSLYSNLQAFNISYFVRRTEKNAGNKIFYFNAPNVGSDWLALPQCNKVHTALRTAGHAVLQHVHLWRPNEKRTHNVHVPIEVLRRDRETI